MSDTLAGVMSRLEATVGSALQAQDELRAEFAALFKTVVVDRAMAVGRARRLLEVLVVDRYIAFKALTPPYGKKLKTLYKMIEDLGGSDGLSRPGVSLCHAVRLEGNRVLHYAPDHPGAPKWPAVSDQDISSTVSKLLEVAEMLGTGGHSVYMSSLPPPFADMYERLRGDWRTRLNGKAEGDFPLFEALDLLFRSVVPAMKADWLGLLKKYAENTALPVKLGAREEDGLRKLRNLSLVEHDRKWLFTPERSTSVWPSPAGRAFMALAGHVTTVDIDLVARQLVKRLKKALDDERAITLLHHVREGKPLAERDKAVARRLRNLYLVRHDDYFLQSAERITLTDLGYYVLGKRVPD